MNRLYKYFCQGLVILLAIIVTFLGSPMPAQAEGQDIVKAEIHHLAEVKPQIDLSEFSNNNVLSQTQIFNKVQSQPTSSTDNTVNSINQDIFTDTNVGLNSINQGTLIAWRIPFVSDLIDSLRSKNIEPTKPEPNSTRGLGKRGPCYSVDDPFIALVPPTKYNSDSKEKLYALGQTLEKSPNIWVYISKLPKNVDSVELMLQDENDEDVINQPVTIPNLKPGFFSLNISTTQVALEVDRAYHWHLSLVCDALRPSRNLSVDAWVKRIPSQENFLRQLETTTEKKRIELYIEQGIWYEALNLIAKLRCRYPKDALLINQWRELLENIGIDEKTAQKIAKEPMMCTSLV